MFSKRSFIFSVLLALVCLGGTATPALGMALDCLIEPYVVVTVSTPEVGLLKSVDVDRGDVVKRNQVLAQLDSTVESATNAVSHARANMTNKRLAELELRRATAELERRKIRSPVDGVVLERFLSRGEFAKQDPILKLAQLDPLRVEAFAPVSLLGQIAVGMEARIIPEGSVENSYRARVTIVDKVVDAASGTFGVRLELPNPKYRLPAGLRCKVELPESTNPAVTK